MTTRTIDTGTDHLLARVTDRVATLTMNRPERRNAFSGEMLTGMARALEAAETARTCASTRRVRPFVPDSAASLHEAP